METCKNLLKLVKTWGNLRLVEDYSRKIICSPYWLESNREMASKWTRLTTILIWTSTDVENYFLSTSSTDVENWPTNIFSPSSTNVKNYYHYYYRPVFIGPMSWVHKEPIRPCVCYLNPYPPSPYLNIDILRIWTLYRHAPAMLIVIQVFSCLNFFNLAKIMTNN